jgi:RNA polymerase sigma-70 factor (ECF subfamily)
VTLPVSERELAWRLVAGDEAALRDTYRTYAPAVYGLALRVLRDPTLAEDVTQDVFVRLWEHPDRFDPDRGQLRSYLLAMTHSRAVERVRAEDSRRRRHEAAAAEAQVVMPAVDEPGRELTTSETACAVRNALDDLPDDQRIPIEMAYYEGLSYRQVAEKLQEPEGTVKYRIRSGMQKLRGALRALEVAP